MHPFEREGLGKAPFQVVGCNTRVGPWSYVDEQGITITIGSPGQPMGVCKYCYQGISQCFIIRSADGKEFDVGSSCVAKTADKTITKEVNRIKTENRNALTDARIARAKDRFENDEAVRENLKGKNHGRMGQYQYVEFCLRAAGRAGKLKVTKMIEQAIKEVESNG